MNLLRVLYKSIFKHGKRGYHHGHRFARPFHHDMPEEFYRHVMMHRQHHFHHHGHGKHGMWMHQRPTIKVIEANCTGCGKCTGHCPQGVLTMTSENNKHHRASVQHADRCIGCRHCLQACRFGAITFEKIKLA